MGIKVSRSLVCDRCGFVVDLEDDSFGLFDLRDTHPDWARVEDDRVLCPSCVPGYELLKARHKIETEDYLTAV